MPACPGCSGVGDPVAGTARPGGGEVRTTVRRLPPGATGAASQPGITPWPSALAPHSFTGDARVSRAQVTSMVANTLARETLREALVATYVWGKGKSGSPGGSGPTTLHKILAAEDLPARRLRSLAQAVGRETGHDPDGAVAAWVWKTRTGRPTATRSTCPSCTPPPTRRQRQTAGPPMPPPTCSTPQRAPYG
ncbi:hypothetical protein ABT215_25215 [Streptomyces sp900105755]|uniref:8-oxoguanine DNA glycosylase OGG fold protein n=1 Tax=Streptomyces sp. 900105755 TaxID=3154389 RepID=UPI003324DEBB